MTISAIPSAETVLTALKRGKAAPGTITEIVFIRGETPMLTIDNAAECMDRTVIMEYSKANGVSWIICLDNMDLSGRNMMQSISLTCFIRLL